MKVAQCLRALPSTWEALYVILITGELMKEIYWPQSAQSPYVLFAKAVVNVITFAQRPTPTGCARDFVALNTCLDFGEGLLIPKMA
ncbi:hypothetical protein EVAR_52665_1 [Eumeta japonica]|uniref:Uncharacterized protein n=1 Tax=Eumeta variegata TaxID=151549 RepID=A0A4C1Z2M7_EUMVA|nr:hypothetical protein EVAR_52665_1 [Eumeta japonica]